MVMHRLACILIVLLLVASAPPVGAQNEAILVLEDPRGDERLYSDTADSQSAGEWGGVDLVGLSIRETPGKFVFDVHVASLEPLAADRSGIDSGFITIHLRHADEAYEVGINRPPGQENSVFGHLYRWNEATQRFSHFKDLNASVDPAAATLSVHVPRSDLVDRDGDEPIRGRSFQDVRVDSYAYVPMVALTPAYLAGAGELAVVKDFMPDQPGVGSYDVQLGGQESGGITLRVEEPFRASNGEATTIIFELEAGNGGDQPDLFRLSAEETPAGWEVVFPADEVRIPARSSVTVPVLVSLPFKHEHGSLETVQIQLASLTQRDASASAEVGVEYVGVPQPAGHHSVLHLHSHAYSALTQMANPRISSPNGELFMNTLETAGDDMPEGVSGTIVRQGDDTLYAWYAHLEPGLRLGLDFDMDQLGSLRAGIKSERAFEPGTVGGRLLLLGPTDEENPRRYPPFNGRQVTQLAQLEPAVTPWEWNEEKWITLDLIPTAEADLVPYLAGQDLVLEVTLSDSVGPEAGFPPWLLPGTQLDLPLNEYSDPVDDAFAALGAASLAPQGVQEARVNPGEAWLFEARLKNTGSAATTYNAALRGAGSEWARLLTSSKVELGAGESTTLRLAVEVPADARDAERADVVLDVSTKGADASRSLLRFVVIVDVEEDHLDRSSELTQSRTDGLGIPAPSLFTLLALLGVGAVLRRRR